MNISIVQLEMDGKSLVVGLGMIQPTAERPGGPRFISQFSIDSPTLERDIEEWKTKTLAAEALAQKVKSSLISNIVSFPTALSL